MITVTQGNPVIPLISLGNGVMIIRVYQVFPHTVSTMLSNQCEVRKSCEMTTAVPSI